MNTKWIGTIIALLTLLVIVGCQPGPSGTVHPSIEWSEVKMPAIGKLSFPINDLPLTVLQSAPFTVSDDGKTIYAWGSDQHWLAKSTDEGNTWEFVSIRDLMLQHHKPGHEIGIHEVRIINDVLFVFSFTDIFRSEDGGRTFEILPCLPGIEEGKDWLWCIDIALDASDRPVFLAGCIRLWTLSYPYEHWVDEGLPEPTWGINPSPEFPEGWPSRGAWAAAFSPNYAEDGQIVAVISDIEHEKTWVTMKYGSEGWGKRMANAPIPDEQTNYCISWQANIAFPDDYDSQSPTLYVGTGIESEADIMGPIQPEYCDVYRIDGNPVGSGPSVTTDLDVRGKGTGTPIYSLVITGSADKATILAGGVGQVYRSTDGGRSWEPARKPPTGGSIVSLAVVDSPSNEEPIAYCSSFDLDQPGIPRGADVPVPECAFSRSFDGGVTWNQVGIISTNIGEVIDRVASPDFAYDGTAFVLTRSEYKMDIDLDDGETIVITREPDASGVTAWVRVSCYGGVPTTDTISVNGQIVIAGQFWGGLQPQPLDDELPAVTVSEDPGEATNKVIIAILDGSVTVTKGEKADKEGEVGSISVDGDASDWQGIEPVAIDPEGDAPSKDEDLKAFYVTNDGEYLYVMVELYSQTPLTKCDIDIKIDADLDGDVDYIIQIKYPDEPFGPVMHLLKHPSEAGAECVCEDIGVLGQVVEARVPLKFVSQMEGAYITQIDLLTWVGEEQIIVDTWQGSLEVNIQEFATPTSISGATPIPFPSTESLWKTTDGGNTWERILTSNLKLLVDGEVVQVGTLEAIALSDNFAEDNTLFVYEGGDDPRVWVSTDGGATFTIQQ